MLRDRFRVILAFVALSVATPQWLLAQATPIRVPVPVPVTAPDLSDPFFDDTVLHDIKLTINEKDWQSLKDHFLENTPYLCYWQVDNQPLLRNVAIRSRGTGSRSAVKPGLRVDFDFYAPDQKFLGLKSVILRNNTQDPSGVRERLSMAFFRRMGLKAEREAHARLFIRGAYVGLYTIVESLDKPWLLKNFGENDGHLYEYKFDNTQPIPYNFGYLGPDPNLYAPVPFKPQTLESDPQGEVLERLFWTINVAGDAIWRTAMAELLDLAKFIRHLAIENFLAEEDGITGDYGPNNFYFYRFENTNLYQFLPWDKSNTFWESPAYSIFRNIDDGPENHRNRLVLRAFQIPELRELYLNTLLECADSILQAPVVTPTPTPAPTPTPVPAIGWLESEVTRIANQIRDANYTDPSREVFTNADWDESIRFLTDWARTRSDIVRAQVAADRARRASQR